MNLYNASVVLNFVDVNKKKKKTRNTSEYFEMQESWKFSFNICAIWRRKFFKNLAARNEISNLASVMYKGKRVSCEAADSLGVDMQHSTSKAFCSV